jgi:hypothetical protein
MENEGSTNQESTTSPDADHPGEATSPPANPDVDQDAVEEGQEKLDQAGAGH